MRRPSVRGWENSIGLWFLTGRRWEPSHASRTKLWLQAGFIHWRAFMGDAGAASADEMSIVTAGILIIGDEILSGRTKDRNSGYIAEYCTNIGIDVREVRVVPDVQEEIVAPLNALRSRYTHIFTTGGIGPTHDDITADAVADAFGVGISVNERAREMLLERLK